jgi:hypothetical protein
MFIDTLSATIWMPPIVANSKIPWPPWFSAKFRRPLLCVCGWAVEHSKRQQQELKENPPYIRQAKFGCTLLVI